MDELDEEADEAHDGESNRSCQCNLLEFFSVWLGAPLHQSDGVLGELSHGLYCGDDLIHSSFFTRLLFLNENNSELS